MNKALPSAGRGFLIFCLDWGYQEMALSVVLSHPATKWSRRLASLLMALAAALLVLAGGSALLDLRQEAINQKEYPHRSEKLDFVLVETLAGHGMLLAPETVNAWTGNLHIGWSQVDVGPDQCKEQSYLVKKPGPSVFTRMPNDWYLCGRAPAGKFALPAALTSAYWLYPLQVLFIGVILAWLGLRLWPRRRAIFPQPQSS